MIQDESNWLRGTVNEPWLGLGFISLEFNYGKAPTATNTGDASLYAGMIGDMYITSTGATIGMQ